MKVLARSVLTGALLITAMVGMNAHAQASTVSGAGVLPLTSTMPDSVPAGTPAIITLTGVNNTGETISDAYVSILFAKSLARISDAVSPVAGAVCGSANVRLQRTFGTCFFGTLAPGATVSAQFTVVPNGGASDLPIDTSMNAKLPTLFGIASEYFGPQLIAVTPGPTDLQLGGSASTSSPARGATYSYTYQVKNVGSQPSLNTALTVSSASGLFTSATTNSGRCDVTPIGVACALGSVAKAGQATITVTAHAPLTPGTYGSTAIVSNSNGDTKISDNTASLPISVR